ncbi:MAG: tyrosine-type recombinase/integrase [Clostridium sp.]|nr:tyrosine-type recombinase/integrase [Clostridium sp.]
MRVDPIKNKSTVVKIINELEKESERNALLFKIGIYTGLRIKDILKLKVKNINGSTLEIQQSKTKKYKRIQINDDLRNSLKKYIDGRDKEEYLIKSRNGINEPLSYSQAYRIIKRAIKRVRLKGNYGTHSLRKTYGYALYENNDLSIVQGALDHDNQVTTLKYIGVTEEEINKATMNIKFY